MDGSGEAETYQGLVSPRPAPVPINAFASATTNHTVHYTGFAVAQGYESSSSSDSDQFQLYNPSGNFYGSHDFSSDEEEEASVYDYNYESHSESSVSESQGDSSSLPALFRDFLVKLKKNPNQNFRFRRFKTCSEVDRKKCAEMFLDAVTDGTNVTALVRTVASIQAHPPNNQQHLKFIDYLKDLTESRISHLLKQVSRWTPLRNIGKFLAILNSKNAISNVFMNIWLDGVQSFVSKNNISATNCLLEVLKVTLKQMKTKDPAKFDFYVAELLRISKTPRHPGLAEGMDKLINNILKAAQASTVVKNQAIIQNVSITLPGLFHKFLVDLKQNPEQEFNIKLFKSCSEDDRKKCAQLALDAAIADRIIIEPLARVIQTIQCSATPNNTNHLKLSDHLSQIIESKIDHLVKQQSKWNPLESIGNFLAQMYNYECIKNDTMNKWLDSLLPFVANTNVRGTNVYVSVLKSCSEKLKFKNPTKFKFHVLQLQNLHPTVWLSPELQEWKIDFLRLHSKTEVRAADSATNLQQQQSTGAIRKTTSTQVIEVIPQIVISGLAPKVSPLPFDRSADLASFSPMKPTIMMVQQKLNKMYGNHDALQILDEIVALRVEMTAFNLRKITNIFAQKIVSRPDIIKSSVDILENLPHRSILPFDKKELENPLMQSILDQICHLQKLALLAREAPLNDIFKFITQLHSRMVIDTDVIVEIIEKVAVASEQDENFRFNVVAKFLETYSACLMTKTDRLKDTGIFLQKYRTRCKSSEMLEKIDDAMKLISVKKESKKAEPIVNCLPSTSAACVTTDNKKTFLDMLLELPTKGINEIKTIAGQIKSRLNCDEFTEAFYEAAMKTEQFSIYAEITQAVERELSAEFTGAFNKSVVQFLYASYVPMTYGEMKASKEAENRLKFIGELYKIKWITIDELVNVLEKLSETELLVQLFHTLLNIVALSVAKNGDGDKLAKFQEIYVQRQDGYENSTSDFLTCRNVIIMLDDIAALSTKRVAFNAEAVEMIIDGLNTKNIKQQAKMLKSLCGGTKADFVVIVTAILNKLAESDDEQLMSTFYCQLQEVFDDSKAQLNEVFVDKIQELLISKFLQPEDSNDKLREYTLITFIGALYTMNVLDSSFIAMCCEILVESSAKNKNDCLYVLLLGVGAKLDAKDQNTANQIFLNFDKIVKEEGTDSRQAENLRSLIELRANGWQPSRDSNTTQHSFALLENLTRSNLISASTSQQIVKMCESSPQDLVTSFYFSVLRNPDKADLYAELSGIVQKHLPVFKDHLKERLRNHSMGVLDLKKQELNEEQQSDLATTTIFTAELYVRDLIDDDMLTFLLKPAKHLSFNSISQLAAVIGEKVSGGDNIRLKALLMNLEEVAQDETKQFWDDLKKDISDITEKMTKNNE